jgi:hypothetical protein
MIVRRNTLSEAFDELQTGALKGASSVVVSRSWWEALSAAEQNTYRSRAERTGITLRVDDQMTSHFVEVRGGEIDPPLSTEHPI